MTEHPTVSKQNHTNPQSCLEARKVKVGIVDDHPMVREGLRAFLGYAEDIEVAFLASNGTEALERTVRMEPDVVLMDLVMPGEMDGIEATQRIRTQAASVHVIALTSFQETERVLAALDAGAIGYLQKDVSPADLLAAIRHAAVGRSVLDPAAFAALHRVSRHHPPSDTLVEPLTSREQEVLDALAAGFSNKEIASKLGISDKTVKVHVSHILSKLGVYDRTQALLAAAKLGLIQLNLKR